MPPDDDDVLAKHGEADDLGMGDPVSDAAAAERQASAIVQRALDDFQRRHEGLASEEIDGQIHQLYEIVRKSHAGLPPGARRVTLLEHFSDMLARDPSRRRWWFGADEPEVGCPARDEPTSPTTDPELRYPRSVYWCFNGVALRKPYTAIYLYDHNPDLRVLTSLEPFDDGDWWHLSVTRTYERATDADIELVRRDFDMVDAFESDGDPGILGRVRRIGPALRHLWLRTTPHPDGRRAPANAAASRRTDGPSR